MSHIDSRRTVTGRVQFLDVLRLVAAVQMIQGHTLDAVLDAGMRTGASFEAWTRLRGLTAVTFLFVAGLSFHLATLARLERHRADASEVRGRAWRVATLFGLGYLLHLPLGAWAAGTPAGTGAFVVDILQCMAVCLGIAELIALAVTDARAARLGIAALGLGVLAASPTLSGIQPAGAWLPLENYLSARAGSPFPLLPWAMHFFAGAALGGWLLGAAPAVRALRLSLMGIGLWGCAAWMPSVVVAEHLGRLASVALLSAPLALADGWLPRLHPVLHRLSRATLTLYVVHILLVYGDGLGLSSRVGATLPLLPALGVVAAVLAISGAAVFVEVGRVPARLAARLVPG